ncbi:MAG: hypothetical protein RL273_1404 [Bacteroidota bacterium]|jgi:predicted transcriptional regulator
MSTTLSIRISDETKTEIEALAKESNRKKSDMLLGWINEKLDLERWQIAEIKKGITQADAGIFATNEEVTEFFHKWVK